MLPLQRILPEAVAAPEEEIASSSLSLKEEIDKFHFEEEENPRAPIVNILDMKGETDRHSGVHTPTFALLDNSFEEEEDGMALNKGNKSLRDLMAAQNKVSTSKEATKFQVPPTLPPPPPSLPADLGLKAIPDLKKKRPVQELKEGEVSLQKGANQQKVAKDPRDRRSTSVDSREEQNRANVHLSQHTWSPQLKVDGATIPWNTSIRDFQRGCAGYIVEALEHPLLLPRDMEAYRRFKQNDLFLSLKRDLAMESSLSYPWV